MTTRAALIFDLDGTLVHSTADIRRALNHAMATLGLAPFTLAEVQGFVGNGVPVLIDRAMAARAVQGPGLHDRLLTAFLADYSAAPAALTRPYPGVAETLRRLVAAGHRLGVCTNKPLAPARAILADLGLLPLVAVVIGGDSLPLRKPDPAPLQATIAALGATVGSALFIGDSEIDADCARRAGVRFLLYTEGYRKSPVANLPHAAAFAAFADLPGLVERLCPPADTPR
jgi:phosphoglycolate phosphatase